MKQKANYIIKTVNPSNGTINSRQNSRSRDISSVNNRFIQSERVQTDNNDESNKYNNICVLCQSKIRDRQFNVFGQQNNRMEQMQFIHNYNMIALQAREQMLKRLQLENAIQMKTIRQQNDIIQQLEMQSFNDQQSQKYEKNELYNDYKFDFEQSLNKQQQQHLIYNFDSQNNKQHDLIDIEYLKTLMKGPYSINSYIQNGVLNKEKMVELQKQIGNLISFTEKNRMMTKKYDQLLKSMIMMNSSSNIDEIIMNGWKCIKQLVNCESVQILLKQKLRIQNDKNYYYVNNLDKCIEMFRLDSESLVYKVMENKQPLIINQTDKDMNFDQKRDNIQNILNELNREDRNRQFYIQDKSINRIMIHPIQQNDNSIGVIQCIDSQNDFNILDSFMIQQLSLLITQVYQTCYSYHEIEERMKTYDIQQEKSIKIGLSKTIEQLIIETQTFGQYMLNSMKCNLMIIQKIDYETITYSQLYNNQLEQKSTKFNNSLIGLSVQQKQQIYIQSPQTNTDYNPNIDMDTDFPILTFSITNPFHFQQNVIAVVQSNMKTMNYDALNKLYHHIKFFSQQVVIALVRIMNLSQTE